MFGTGYLNSTGCRIAVVVTAAAAVGVGVYRYLTYRAHVDARSSWIHVGQVTHLLCYPIKSCAAVSLQHSECSILGLQTGLLRDRTFMVVKTDGKNITGRTHPKLVKIIPQVIGPRLTLQAEGMDEMSISIYDLQLLPTVNTSVWDQEVATVDCGDEAAAWVTKFLLPEAEDAMELRLVYYPSPEPSRAVRPKNVRFSACTERDVGALADATSYNLITKASVDELNERLIAPVAPEQFRPNFVVDSSRPCGEDEWERVRIGQVEFQNIKPCTRCLFTTVNPVTGVKSADGEPLTTLKTYRRMTSPAMAQFTGDLPVFGIHLALQQPGHINIGDEVYAKFIEY